VTGLFIYYNGCAIGRASRQGISRSWSTECYEPRPHSLSGVGEGNRVGEEVGTKGVDMRGGSREANDAAGGKLATINIEVHAQESTLPLLSLLPV
jgi:hypothetical protein